MTAYGDRIELLTIPAVLVGGTSPRLVVRAAPTGGLFVRIEVPPAGDAEEQRGAPRFQTCSA